MKEIRAFKCEFCGKYTMSKSYVKAHERKCFHNPATKSCVTCWYWSPISERQERDGVMINRVKEMSCKKGISFDKGNSKQIFKTNCLSYAEMFNDPISQPTFREEHRKLKKEARRLNQVTRLYAITKAYDCFAKQQMYVGIANTKNDYKEAEQTANLANLIFHDRDVKSKPADFLYDVNEMADKAVDRHNEYKHILELIDDDKFRFAGVISRTIDAFCKAVEYGYHTESGYKYKCIILKTIGHVQYPEILATCISFLAGNINILQFRHLFHWVGFSMKVEPIDIRSFARQMTEIDSLYREIEQKQKNRLAGIHS